MIWDDEWIKINWPGRCTLEFAELYSNHVGYNIKKDTLRKHIARSLKLKNNFREISKDVENYIIENYSKLGWVKINKAVRDKFGDESIKHIRNIIRKYGLRVPKDIVYKNLDLDPSGTLSIQESTGYVYIKIDHGKWCLYHKYLYEEKYGKIPDDYCIIFLDNNNRNFDLSNLYAIPKKYQRYLNSNHMRSDNPDITKTAILWCELKDVLDKKGE